MPSEEPIAPVASMKKILDKKYSSYWALRKGVENTVVVVYDECC